MIKINTSFLKLEEGTIWEIHYIDLGCNEKPQTETEKLLVSNFHGMRTRICYFQSSGTDKHSVLEDFNGTVQKNGGGLYAIDAKPC